MSTEDHKQALPPGFRLGAYHVVRVLGVGGFGVTYVCEHTGLAVQVAVKEYLPNEIAVRDGTEVHPKSAGDREGFEWGLSRFLDEARTLARFEHPNVVRVRDCFEANSTAYIVMDYEEGEPLDALLRRHGTLTEAQLNRVLLPVVDGLRQVHAAGFLHRDIKPANIFVRRSDESPVLLDFGSARQALGRRSRSVTAIASAGYSPPEQYESDGHQGAWTDIYALSALCYRAITGDVPMEAPRRQGQLLRMQTDPLPKLAEAGREDYSPEFLEAVDRGLRVIEAERPQSLDEWLPRLEKTDALPAQDSELTEASQPASSPTAHQTGKRKAGRRDDRVPWLVAGLLLLLWLVWFAQQKDVGQVVGGHRNAAEQPFTVLVEPADARVRIPYIGQPYRPGMELASGSYDVEASAPGYATKTETVAHGAGPTVHRMALSPLGQPFTVLVTPPDARIRILNIGPPYQAGMELAAGSYEVEASAPGYVTMAETVAHGAGPTVYRMVMHRAGPKVGDRFRDCPECPEMVVVPAGSYRMGSPSSEQDREENEGPVHEVTIGAPLCVGKYEVTFAQWDACAHDGSCPRDEDIRPPGLPAAYDWRWGRGQRPVIMVSWDDAHRYVQWLSGKTNKPYRLLSESEWEYAVRAGTETAYSWGEEIGVGRANCDECGSRWDDQTAPVGSFAANAWGLHDMHGNVWEWVEDCWNESYTEAPRDGSAWRRGNCSRRVLRGGSWVNWPSGLRAATRYSFTTDFRSPYYGFRVARSLAP